MLRDAVPVQDAEVIDAAVMNVRRLREFFAREIESAKSDGVLLSLHLKATMMKVSDPIMFGHAVRIFYADVFDKHAALFEELGVEPNNGIGDVYTRISELPEERRAAAIEADLAAVYEERPALAMVNSDKGITNLHVPSDVIIDASMPAMRCVHSGKMWGPDGELHDTLAMIPDRCYAGIYQAVIDNCKRARRLRRHDHGQCQQRRPDGTEGRGIRLTRQDVRDSRKTARVRVIDEAGEVLMEHEVEAGDIWRMCQTRDLPIRDWVRLAVSRARATGATAIFWLDEKRAHDARLIDKVNEYLQDHDTDGLDIRIHPPVEAMLATLERVRAGDDTISVTGNVLRDYLTDLFPILELGTSAKMLSIVPLLAGGGLYETGAGGSAPKHVQQFLAEGHLRWDSLGEFLALAVSIEDLAEKTGNADAGILARALDEANGEFLANNKAPSRKVNELDNRGSHFYLAMYWARALADQPANAQLAARFAPVAAALAENETKIVNELNAAQGRPMDIGGYYHPDDALASDAMRPSATLNSILAELS